MELTKIEQLKLTLQLMECHFGSHHLTLAESVSELADEYLGHKDYAKAEPLYWRALEIRQRHLGSDDPEVAKVFRSDGAYIITGGLGGLGLFLATQMGKAGCGRIVLTARSNPTAKAQQAVSRWVW